MAKPLSEEQAQKQKPRESEKSQIRHHTEKHFDNMDEKLGRMLAFLGMFIVPYILISILFLVIDIIFYFPLGPTELAIVMTVATYVAFQSDIE